MRRIESRVWVAGFGDLSETSYGVILSDKFRKVSKDEIILGLRGARYEKNLLPKLPLR